MLVDGAVKITPLAPDLDVGLIDPDRSTVRAPELAQPLLDDRCVGEDPAINSTVINLEASLVEHFFQIG